MPLRQIAPTPIDWQMPSGSTANVSGIPSFVRERETRFEPSTRRDSWRSDASYRDGTR